MKNDTIKHIKKNYILYSFIFLFYCLIVFFSFHLLFSSYFEADEWFHFTYNFPFTNNSHGLLNAVIGILTNNETLSAGQHVDPIAATIFYLNSKYFGIHFPFYVFMSLLLHSINSFLVFIFIKELLPNKKNTHLYTVTAVSGGIFFALAASPMHAVMWAAFYALNVLSVTFFLLCLIVLKYSFQMRKKKYIYLSALFFLFDLMTKETAVVLIFIIPLIIFFEKCIFSKKFLVIIFSIPLLIYFPYRFITPLVNFLINQQLANGTSSTSTQSLLPIVLYRIITFPIKMIPEIFFPRITIQTILKLITPLIYSQYGEDPAAKSANLLQFLYGPGNDYFVYLFFIFFVIFFIYLLVRWLKKKRKEEVHTFLIGLCILTLSALPLVFIVFTIPTWGYDLYFDSRHFYMPAVGAAIIFSLSILTISELITPIFEKYRIKYGIFFSLSLLTCLWIYQNNKAFNPFITSATQIGKSQRMIIEKMKHDVPILPNYAVFYTETDKTLGQTGSPQPILPFATSFAQVLTVVYFQPNPLPHEFFDKTIFPVTGTGYLYAEGRMFGYYRSKRDLEDAILAHHFASSNVYSFYYNPQTNYIENITSSVRNQLTHVIQERKNTIDWKLFSDPKTKITFNYAPDITISNITNSTTDPKIVTSLELKSQNFMGQINFITITPSIDIQEIRGYFNQSNGDALTIYNTKTVPIKLDDYHINNVIVTTNDPYPKYLLKLNNVLVSVSLQNFSPEGKDTLERMIGSIQLQ